MSEYEGMSPFSANAGARSTTSQLLFGQVMWLVAVAIGFFAAGAYIGRHLTSGTGFLLEIIAIVMVFAQNFVPALRRGALGTAWLYSIALLLGLGLAPILNYYTTYDPTVVYQAAGGTALTVAGMGCYGFFTSRDLMRWARPLFAVLFIVILASWVLVLFGSGGNPVLSVIIYLVVSAVLAINFQYLRRSAQADDAIWIATSIFINILNIFLILLQLFGNNR